MIGMLNNEITIQEEIYRLSSEILEVKTMRVSYIRLQYLRELLTKYVEIGLK